MFTASGAAPVHYHISTADALSGQLYLSSGQKTQLDLTASVPTSNSGNTVGDCLNAARAQGFGNWVINSGAKTLTLYAPDGSTIVRAFSLDSISAPTSRS